MISGKRRTIGVFLCKAYSLFDNTVYHTLEKEAKKHDFDVIVFTTVGYFSSQNDYDTQERGMFAFAPIEQLDGIIVAPDTYEIEGFRDQLHSELSARAACPVISIRHLGEEFDCVHTDEDLALRPLLRHLLEDHGLKRICFWPDTRDILTVNGGFRFSGRKWLPMGSLWMSRKISPTETCG